MPPAHTAEWGTPSKLFDALAMRYGPFDLDPCGRADHYVSQQCGRFFSKADDGLGRAWPGRVFVNPPYGRALNAWVRKCWLESRGVADVVVALVPARTDTLWWQRYVATDIPGLTGAPIMASEIHFLPGRVHFAGSAEPAPFPSVVVVWRAPPWQRGANPDAGADQRPLVEPP